MSIVKRTLILFALFMSAIFTSTVGAQCATSVNTGGGNCVPPDAPGMPGYNQGRGNAAPPEPKPIWKETWGAIAIDSKTGNAGTVTDRDSKSDAAADAMHDCAMRGATGCRVELTYFNQCAAVAWGNAGRGLGRSPDKADAEDLAMQSCEKSATDGCKVVYSGCSEARRIR